MNKRIIKKKLKKQFFIPKKKNMRDFPGFLNEEAILTHREIARHLEYLLIIKNNL